MSARRRRKPEPREADLKARIRSGLSRLAIALKAEAWQTAGPEGLSPTQAQILSHLARASAPARLSQVAEELAVTPATASAAVSTLVAKGYVEKTASPDDARAVALVPTREGRKLAGRVTEAPDVLASAVDALRPAEQEVFLVSLVTMVHTLQTEGRIAPARVCVTCRFFRPRAHPGEPRPHHCAYVDAPLGGRDLRLDCGDHDALPAAEARAVFDRFRGNGKEEDTSIAG
ncbi:MAG: winged helix-turn-helix transcriptional regulator [Acidobacteria bacterium]|nr:winged helix-turn-helix transcriptional regulator [Acidobacteriota bacterium]